MTTSSRLFSFLWNLAAALQPAAKRLVLQILIWENLPVVEVFFLYIFLSQRYTIPDERFSFWFCWKKGRLYFFCLKFLFSLLFFNDLKTRRIKNYVIFCCSPYCAIDFFVDCSFFFNHTFYSRFLLLVCFSPLHPI